MKLAPTVTFSLEDNEELCGLLIAAAIFGWAFWFINLIVTLTWLAKLDTSATIANSLGKVIALAASVIVWPVGAMRGLLWIFGAAPF